MKSFMCKMGVIAVALSCLLTVGCKAKADEGELASKDMKHQVLEMQSTMDEIKALVDQMRDHLTKMSDAEMKKSMEEMNHLLEQMDHQMQAFDETLVASGDLALKETMPLWVSSMNMLHRAMVHMQSSMTMMDHKEARGREMMHHAMNNMEHSLRSMDNSMKVILKKLERLSSS